MNGLLTIMMPVYERTVYFKEALNSALSQTVPVQIVVVDNASSHNFFRDFVLALKNPAVSYVRNDSNLGMYGNWNRCAELSLTDYFMILGDDDVLEPIYVESFLEAQDEYPEIAAYFSQIKRFGDSYSGSHPASPTPIGLVYGQELLRNAIDFGLNVPTVAMTLSRKLFERYKFEYTPWAYSQDWLFAYSALSDRWCFNDSRKLLNYRVHAQGNALIVGERAFLSTAYIYSQIASQLIELGDLKWGRLAQLRETWVPRHSVIAGHAVIVRELIDQSDNPFGKHLKQLVATDYFLRQALRPGLLGTLAGKVLHARRFISRFIKFF